MVKLQCVVEAADKYPDKFGLHDNIDSHKLSTNKAYRLVKKEEKREELSNAEPNISLPNGYKLILGDFVEKSNEINNDSIDLIFTDPLYGK